MGDHGIVSGYRANATGKVEPVLCRLATMRQKRGGLRLYRSTLYEFCAALDF